VKRPFNLTVDAAKARVSGVLSQWFEYKSPTGSQWKDRPIQFFSKSLTLAEVSWSTIEKEFYAIALTVKKFNRFLYGRQFIVFTDHKPLTFFDTLRLETYNQVRIRHAMFLSQFSFKIFHIEGIKNWVADYLTRSDIPDMMLESDSKITLPCEDEDTPLVSCKPQISSIEMISEAKELQLLVAVSEEKNKIDQNELTLDIGNNAFWKTQQDMDPHLNALNEFLKHERLPQEEEMRVRILNEHHSYISLNNVVYYNQPANKNSQEGKTLLVVPPHLRRDIIALHHSTLTSAHQGQELTRKRILDNFTWPTLAHDVVVYVLQCRACSMRKVGSNRLTHISQPFQYISAPFQQLSIDTMGPITTSKSNEFKSCVTIIDSYSGLLFAEAVTTSNAESTTSLLKKVFLTHGAARVIASDNGKEFANDFVTNLLKTFSVIQRLSIPYRPQTNGKIERSHRELMDKLMILLKSCPINAPWSDFLPFVVYAMNIRARNSLPSPYFVAFGRQPEDIHLSNFLPSSGNVTAINDMAANLEYAQQLVAMQNQKTIEFRKKKLEEIKNIPTYHANDRVLVRIPKRKSKTRDRYQEARVISQTHPNSFRYLIELQSTKHRRFAHVSEFSRRTRHEILPDLSAFLDSLDMITPAERIELGEYDNLLKEELGNAAALPSNPNSDNDEEEENEEDEKNEEIGEDGYQFACYKCKTRGNVLLCEGRTLSPLDPSLQKTVCSRVAHTECVGLEKEPAEDEPWYCEFCIQKAKELRELTENEEKEMKKETQDERQGQSLRRSSRKTRGKKKE